MVLILTSALPDVDHGRVILKKLKYTTFISCDATNTAAAGKLAENNKNRKLWMLHAQ